MTLTDFLLARIAEDQETALDKHDIAYDDMRFGDCACGYPARVRAEREAKRRVLEVARLFGCEKAVARYLALPYADHPDYREAWRP